MYRLCCDITPFAARSFEEGLAVADALGINDIVLASIGGKGLECCSGDELEDIRCALIDSNKTVVLLKTGLPLSDTAAYNTLFRKAHLLNVKNVAVSLSALAEAPEVGLLLKMAEAWNLGLIFENDPGSFFRDDPSMTAFLKPLPETAAVSFAPAGFVALQKHPFFHVFYGSRLKNRIRFLRLEDTLYSTGEPTPLGGGNGEVKELISILLSRSYDGWFTLTPYLNGTPEGMKQSLCQYKNILKTL